MIASPRLAFAALLSALALSATVLLGGCSSDTDDPATETPAPVAEAGSVANVGVDEFSAAIDNGADVLDVRTPAEFAEGHIEGAVNIDINGPGFADEIAALDKSKTYAVYCRSGNRSAVATDFMQQDGFESLYNLDGGVLDWQSAGYPLV